MIVDMRSWFEQLKNSKGLQQSVITIGGNFLSTGISALAMIIISRLLGPLSFGQFSIGFAIVQILSRLNDSGFNATILKFAGSSLDRGAITEIVLVTFKYKLIISVILIGGGLLLVQPLAQILDFSPWLILISLLFSLASTWYEHLLTTLQALHRFTQAVLSNTIQASFKLIGIGLLWLVGATGVLPIYSWYMLAPLMAVFSFRLLLPTWFHFSRQDFFSARPPSGLLSMARHSAVGFIAAGLIENVDLLFVQRSLNTYEVGLLSGVSRIAMMLTLIAYSLGNVLYPRVARYKSKTDIQSYLKKAFLVMLVSAGGFLAFLPFGQLVILATIGPAYLSGYFILLILMAGAFLTLATIPFLALFYTFKADWYFSLSGVLQLIIVIAGNWLLVPEFGLVMAAWTKLAARLCLFVFTVGLALWLYHRRYHEKTLAYET